MRLFIHSFIIIITIINFQSWNRAGWLLARRVEVEPCRSKELKRWVATNYHSASSSTSSSSSSLYLLLSYSFYRCIDPISPVQSCMSSSPSFFEHLIELQRMVSKVRPWPQYVIFVSISVNLRFSLQETKQRKWFHFTPWRRSVSRRRLAAKRSAAGSSAGRNKVIFDVELDGRHGAVMAWTADSDVVDADHLLSTADPFTLSAPPGPLLASPSPSTPPCIVPSSRSVSSVLAADTVATTARLSRPLLELCVSVHKVCFLSA